MQLFCSIIYKYVFPTNFAKSILTNHGSIHYYCTIAKLLNNIQPLPSDRSSKVTVVGVGKVGMACAFRMLSEQVTTELCLLDTDKNKLMGEAYDLLHGRSFLGHCTILASTDYGITTGSRLCIVTAGVRQREGESKLDLIHRNTEVIQSIIPNLVKYSPDAVILIVSSPCDILTHLAWKRSGLPKERVIGSGTNLDSSRFRFLLSQTLGVASRSCHGWIIGEQGDSSIAVWSGVNIAGMRLMALNSKIGAHDDPENWEGLHKPVIEGVHRVIKLKGYTSWAIGLTVSSIASSILQPVGNIHAVSTLVKGYYGIEDEVFMSLPCVIGANGVTDVITMPLLESDIKALQKSAKRVVKELSGIDL